jgi:hypothetical protein
MVQIRFSAGENTGGQWTPLPEGTYDFRIIEVEQGNSSNGNPQLRTKLEILDGPRAGDKPNTWYSLLPQSGWKLRGLVEALDLDYQIEGQDADGNDLIVFDADELLHRCVRMDVRQREYNGKTTNDFINEAPSEYDTVAEADAGAQEEAPQDPPPQQQTQQAQGGNARGRRRPRPAAR